MAAFPRWDSALAHSRFFPSEPGISPIFDRNRHLGCEDGERYQPAANSPTPENGNSLGRNRVLNTSNRELSARMSSATIEHKKTKETHLSVPPKKHRFI
jgi:hypothetical protein